MILLLIVSLCAIKIIVRAQECGSGAWYSGWAESAYVEFQTATYATDSNTLVVGGFTTAGPDMANQIGEVDTSNAAFISVYQNGGPNPLFATKVETVLSARMVGVKTIKHIPTTTKFVGVFDTEDLGSTKG